MKSVLSQLQAYFWQTVVSVDLCAAISRFWVRHLSPSSPFAPSSAWFQGFRYNTHRHEPHETCVTCKKVLLARRCIKCFWGEINKSLDQQLVFAEVIPCEAPCICMSLLCTKLPCSLAPNAIGWVLAAASWASHKEAWLSKAVQINSLSLSFHGEHKWHPHGSRLCLQKNQTIPFCQRALTSWSSVVIYCDGNQASVESLPARKSPALRALPASVSFFRLASYNTIQNCICQNIYWSRAKPKAGCWPLELVCQSRGCESTSSGLLQENMVNDWKEAG